MTDGKEFKGGLSSGETIDKRFTIEKTLGRGGFAITYLARAGRYNKPYAIKEYLPMTLAVRTADGTVQAATAADKEAFDKGLEDFVREGRRLLECRHPSIVQVDDFFEERGTAYLVMEYVEGSTLSEFLAKNGPMSGPQLMSLLLPMLDALAVLHNKDMLHRDLSPNNIMLRKDTTHPVLIDFGAARQLAAIRSYSLTQICSDGYSPPEQYQTQGKQGPFSDIYALGCVAYRALTGARVPAAVDRLARDTQMADWGSHFPHLKAKLLVPVINKAIALNPAERYQNVAEFKAALAPIEALWRHLATLKSNDALAGVVPVEENDGSLTLTGRVTSRQAADALVEMLRSVAPGITIHEKLDMPSERHAAQFHSEALTVIIDKGADVDQIKRVLDELDVGWATAYSDAASGAVTLSGVAPTLAAREELLTALRARIPGVMFRDITEFATQVPQGVTTTSRNEPPEAPVSSTSYSSGSSSANQPSQDSQGSSSAPRKRSRFIPIALTAGIAALAIAGTAYYVYVGSPFATEAPFGSDAIPGEQLTAPDTPFACNIELPKDRYRIGEQFTFTVEATERSDFLVYTIDADDKVELHDPSNAVDFMGSPWLEAGERRQIPVSDAPGRARIKGPAGTYNVGAVCGREDLAQLGITETDLQEPASRGKRSFEFRIEEIQGGVDRDLIARASVAYTVE